jgi:hypothetical protein
VVGIKSLKSEILANTERVYIPCAIVLIPEDNNS